jgi:hypothetical protein
VDPETILIADAGELDDRRKATLDGYLPRDAESARRASPRQRVLMGAVIVDLKSDAAHPCRLENISATGARVRLAKGGALSANIWLIVLTSGFGYQAEIVWRDDVRLGVRFGEPVDLRDPRSRLEHRLAAIRSQWLR